MSRHRWMKDVISNIPFEATYKVDECSKCGCYRLHKVYDKVHLSTYTLDGKEYEKTPECKSEKTKR